MKAPEAARGRAFVDTFRLNRGSLSHRARVALSEPVIQHVTEVVYGLGWRGPDGPAPNSPGEVLEYRWQLYFEVGRKRI